MLKILVNHRTGDKKFESKHVLVEESEYNNDETCTIINAILAQIPEADLVYEYFIDEE